MKYSFLLTFCCMFQASSYIQTPAKNNCCTFHLHAVSMPNSYQQLREQAARMKSGQSPNVVIPNPVSSNYQSASQSSNVAEEIVEQENANGLPFTDVMYDHFQYVIGKITNRVKTGTPLTKNELDRFEKSVTAIIHDSKKKINLPVVKSVQPPSNSISQNKSPSKNGEFDELKGLSSTWEVEGMENMTTEEYYSALNKRNIAINDERKKRAGPGYDRNPGDNYIEGLSKRN